MARTTRNTVLAMGGTLLAIGAGAAALLLRRRQGEGGKHAAPDLALGKSRLGVSDRAPAAFRPDPTAIPTDAERESLRPATGHASGFAADRGTTVQEPVGA